MANETKITAPAAGRALPPERTGGVAPRRGLYDEFTNLTLSSYSNKDLVRSLIEELGEEFWGFIVELDDTRQLILMETLAGDKDFIAPLFKSARGTAFAQALLVLPEAFERIVRDGFIEEAGKLPAGDSARILMARVFASAKFLEPGELQKLSLRVKDTEIESLLSTMSASQMTVFVKALGADRINNLPNVVKRATVLAQVKSVICSDAMADPAIKALCQRGKWATVRTFGVKK